MPLAKQATLVCVILTVLLRVLTCSAISSPLERSIYEGGLRGVASEDGEVVSFKGIPYAAPPVGELRWKEPQAVEPWQGLRDATRFGPRAMQKHLFDDIFFSDDGPSEDCLYLNVWMPTDADSDSLPVMFWIHGGGFVVGGTSEPRQNGEVLAKKGVVVVSAGYRMGVFGFLAHPELTDESPNEASGNYGLLDMVAALEWVQRNIAEFGGDPGNVTIFGESDGSWAVTSLMASPLAKGLLHKAIAQSGSVLSPWREMPSRGEAEQVAVDFGLEQFQVETLSELRAIPAEDLLGKHWETALSKFSVCNDGYFFPKDPQEVFASGEQHPVPLIAGWTLDESGPEGFLGPLDPTVDNYRERARQLFGDRADEFLALYPANNSDEVVRAAADFAGDRFISHETWRLVEAHSRLEAVPVYRYRFDQTLPLPDGAPDGARARAAHAWEIEYVFNVLESKDLPWRPSDRWVADLMSSYWSNFAKSGNPNAPGLPEWLAFSPGAMRAVLLIDDSPEALSDTHRQRHEFLDSLQSMPQ